MYYTRGVVKIFFVSWKLRPVDHNVELKSLLRDTLFSILKSSDVQSTAHQTIHSGLCTALISRKLSANIELQVYSVTCC
jgi:hypothetical protein